MSTHVTSQTHLSTWFKVLNTLLVIGAISAFCVVGLMSGVALSQALPQTSDKAYWFISRSSGVLAYLLLTFGVTWGLVQSGGIWRPTVPPLLALGLHSFLNWGGLAMGALHGLILLGDNYIKLTLADVAIPFFSSYEPLLVGLGVLGFYLMFLLSSSFYARKWLGQKFFRNLHYASYVTYLLVTWHSLGIGSDSGLLWPLYAASVGGVMTLAIWRIVNTRRSASATRKH
jgi:DMSO/TMAO reductase YedYZ heme-binding membrane subunit